MMLQLAGIFAIWDLCKTSGLQQWRVHFVVRIECKTSLQDQKYLQMLSSHKVLHRGTVLITLCAGVACLTYKCERASSYYQGLLRESMQLRHIGGTEDKNAGGY